MARYCPKCHGEYMDWARRCYDCNVELVDTPPEPEITEQPGPRYHAENNSQYTTDPLVTIAEFADMLDAKLAKEILESEGIKCFVPDRESINLSWSGLLPHVEARLIVKESDEEKALEILSSRGILNGPDSDDSGTAP